MPKINIPMGTEGDLDLTDESKYLSTLIYKTNKTITGEGNYISKTSGKTYSTNDYPDDSDIYNKGELGLIHLFWKLYGGEDGFLILADDVNSYLRPSGNESGDEYVDAVNADTLGGKPPSYYVNQEQIQNIVINILKNQIIFDNAGSHNSIYRGKFLGESVTEAQYAAIADGTFADLYIGDYWTINDRVYRIAAFDYLLNTGDIDCTTHHALMVPDKILYNHVMNDTNITTGAYVGSKMYTEGLEQAKTTIKAAFSGHVLSKRIYLSNATVNGKTSAGAWCDSEVDLMCEHMVYGNGVFSPVSDGTTVPNNYRVEKSQLPLFQHEPSRTCNRANWWLRDVISASRFAYIRGYGDANSNGASYSYGVRPYFCIY